MRTIESLKAEIRVLMQEMAINGQNLRFAKQLDEHIALLAARTEILKSIAHRQGLIIEMMSNDAKFSQKEVA